MNFEQTLKTLRKWQEEENENRCFLFLIADKGADNVQAAVRGFEINVAEGLAEIIGEFPHFDDILQAALNIYAEELNRETIKQFMEEKAAEITEEIRVAQEGESYREEQNL